MTELKICFRCDNKFYPTRSDQLFCSRECRLKYYRLQRWKGNLKCADCSNRSDRFGTCDLWKTFKGKMHPRNCEIL